MAPSRTKTVKSKHAANGSGVRSAAKQSRSQPRIDGAVSKTKKSKSKGAPQKIQAQRDGNKMATLRKKRRVYTEAELGIEKLNMITPVGVEKPRGGKKGKVFVDDRESMMTILSMVNADREGQIESKMMKARQMEEIREARKAEAEARQEEKKSKMDEAKDGLRRKRRKAKADGDATGETKTNVAGTKPLKLRKKSVSFA